ncbi:MAG: pentapeptide repeat-containing protein, partial [Microcystis panniformis]
MDSNTYPRLSSVFWRLFVISIGLVSVSGNNLIAKAANAEQMKQLLATKECPKCDLSKANLSNINLENANLE